MEFGRLIAFLGMIVATHAFTLVKSRVGSKSSALRMISVGQSIPSGSMVDLIAPSNEKEFIVTENQDAASFLNSHNRCVLFAVPGAFTPTCSAKHLPGFIEKAASLKSKGVDAIYCLSVNDRFVMKAWGLATDGCAKNGIKLVADGNGDLTTALGLSKDSTGSRMGKRCMRFAAIVEKGVLKSLFIDEKGLEKSSAENILAELSK